MTKGRHQKVGARARGEFELSNARENARVIASAMKTLGIDSLGQFKIQNRLVFRSKFRSLQTFEG